MAELKRDLDESNRQSQAASIRTSIQGEPMKTIHFAPVAIAILFVFGCGSTPEATGSTEEGVQYVQSREALIADDGSEVERVTPDGFTAKSVIVAGQAGFSFWDSCKSPKSVKWDGDPIIYAAAGGCRRRNGTWSGAVEWSGRCYTDIANVDGALRCN